MRLAVVSSLIWLVAWLMPADGHEDLHLRIEDLDERIAAEPSSELYMRRADLHRRHRDWTRSLRDYAAADRLQPGLAEIRIGRALVHLERGEPAIAIETLEGWEFEPPAGALMLKARALAQLGMTKEADAVFTAGIGRLESQLPEHYLEHAATLAAADPPQPEAAVVVIDRGIAELGDLISLHSKAFEYARGNGDLEAALGRVRKILSSNATSNPEWLLAEGELLTQLGQRGAARRAYQRALESIRALSPRRRGTPAAREIEMRATAALARLQ